MFSGKDTIKRMKIHTTDWEKIFPKYQRILKTTINIQLILTTQFLKRQKIWTPRQRDMDGKLSV